MTEDGGCASCGGGGGGSDRSLVATLEVDFSDMADVITASRPHPEAEKDPLLGQLVADRFLIRSLLGKGGVGRVYSAVQLALERPVALKLLDAPGGLDEERVERFRREARASSRLNHPGVAAVYDFGDWEGQPYIAMELVKGKTMYEVFAAEYPLSAPRVVDILCKVCDVLDVAHRAHIVHRDLKPENVMVLEPEGVAGAERQV